MQKTKTKLYITFLKEVLDSFSQLDEIKREPYDQSVINGLKRDYSAKRTHLKNFTYISPIVLYRSPLPAS
jgi:hypothetical protein